MKQKMNTQLRSGRSGGSLLRKYGHLLKEMPAEEMESLAAGLKEQSKRNIRLRRFGRLIAMYPLPVRFNEKILWACICDCGRWHVTRTSYLKSGQTKSCGCLAKECDENRFKTHGKTKTPEYKSFHHMMDRCENPKSPDYKDYGGRGIKVCERWKKSFENFFDDMKERPSRKHSLERIDVNGHYDPINCKWATPLEQANNKRTTRWMSIGGTLRSASDVSRITGANYDAVCAFAKMGFSYEEMVGKNCLASAR